MRVVVVLCLLLAPAMLSSPAVRADDSDQAISDAKKHFQTGTTSYDEGDYERALSSFERARALKPLPGFLFNIGQCHRKLGRHAEAIRFFEQYVAESPKAKNRAEVDALLVEERALLAAAPPSAVPSTSTTGGGAEGAAEGVVAEPLAPEQAAVEPSADGETPSWVWAAIGGGALVVAAGTVAAIALLPSQSPASLGRVDLRGTP